MKKFFNYGKISVVEKIKELIGVNVRATDLRASAELVIGGLVAKGKNKIEKV